MPKIDSEPIPTIWLDLGGKLAWIGLGIRIRAIIHICTILCQNLCMEGEIFHG